MGLNLEYTDGQTPLEEEEKAGLLIPSITTREELDEFEQLNIQKAIKWSLARRIRQDDILTEDFIKRLHEKMFEDVWRWAGAFRKSNKNIGVEWPFIGTELRYLLDNCRYWIENNTYVDNDELVVRFKHKLVNIHCFPNGNGRHSRLMADIMITNIFGASEFSWGSGKNLVTKGKARERYISAIKSADKGNIELLIEFARS